MTRAKRFTVVIATDGSPAAKAAVATAVQFPWPDGTRAFAVVARQVGADYRRAILRAALDRTADWVARGAARTLSRRWPEAEGGVVDGPPTDAITKAAVRRRADVIVMGWRGHGPVRRLLTGSVSRAVVRRAPCAVLVVRRPLRHLRHIVVGFDDSAQAWRAVKLISRLSAPRGRRLSLLTAVETMPVPSQSLALSGTRAAVAAEVRRINEERLARAHAALGRAARTLVRAGWTVDTAITTGAPLRDILATVAARRAELVVVGAKGVTGVREVLLGSVAEGALNRSPVAVLIVR